ncbi:hypothetical protein V502_06532 [Pseudogymnoascus sp. VKM F-4520 (FW-2644)]|nr:hypothetical protein V502_06532 [Pseudogymnoascus sp. VKM F-4520 (FW-2644)]
MHLILLAVLFLSVGVFATPASSSNYHVVHERRGHLPASWTKRSRIPGDSFLPMKIALTQSNLHKADDFLNDVSHPDSANFGKHWTAKQVAEAFAPSRDTVMAVLDWLKEYGIDGNRVRQSQSLNWLHANVTVAEAETLLRAEYHSYEHSSSDTTHIGCEHYSIPETIQHHIDFVTPTVHLAASIGQSTQNYALNKKNNPKWRRGASSADHDIRFRVSRAVESSVDTSTPEVGGSIEGLIDELRNCSHVTTPDCLRALYEFPANFPANPKNSFGIVAKTPQAYIPSDLDIFFNNYSRALVGQRPTFDSIDGGFLQTQKESFRFNAESDLDLEYAMALAYPQKVTLYQAGDFVEGASFNNFLDAIDSTYCAGDDPNQDSVYPDQYCAAGDYGCYKGPETCGGFAATKVISISYGLNEADLTPAYEIRQCMEYLKLGLQGVTFLYATGDNGVAGSGPTGVSCLDPVTGDLNNGTSGRFNPAFPATCPYITAIGATQIPPNASVFDLEQAVYTKVHSGGGFSNIFAAPSYQSAALKSYLANNPPPYDSSRYNTSMTRGIPDMSANGANYAIAVDGIWKLVYGSSASTPVVASILTLINAARMDFGRGPIGFVNPVLYKYPEMLNDIVEGDNPGCGTNGFTAAEGWDPVTGLGTPNFPRMLATWLALP